MVADAVRMQLVLRITYAYPPKPSYLLYTLPMKNASTTEVAEAFHD